MSLRIFHVGAIIGFWLVLATTSGLAQSTMPTSSIFVNGARTYYEALDFSTPESTAGAFLSAWARHDYATANVTFSPDAQDGWRKQISMYMSFKTLLPTQAEAIFQATVFFGKGAADSKRPARDEMNGDPNLFFDDVMSTADHLHVLPFTIGPAAKIAKTDEAGPNAKISVHTDGQPADLDLDLIRIDNGRWKVDRVELPGADPKFKPWGFPTK